MQSLIIFMWEPNSNAQGCSIMTKVRCANAVRWWQQAAVAPDAEMQKTSDLPQEGLRDFGTGFLKDYHLQKCSAVQRITQTKWLGKLTVKYILARRFFIFFFLASQ